MAITLVFLVRIVRSVRGDKQDEQREQREQPRTDILSLRPSSRNLRDAVSEHGMTNVFLLILLTLTGQDAVSRVSKPAHLPK